MPAMSETPPEPIKGLILADSGSGKTGALWSLAAAGFHIKLYDVDSNSGVLAAALRGNREALARVEVNKFKDHLPVNSNGYASGVPKAWNNFLKALNKWPDNPDEGIDDWGPDTVVVIDTLTSLGRAALQHAAYIEKKFGANPEIQHYNVAGNQIKDTLSNLVSDVTRCHVLVLTHIAYMKNDLGKMFGLPKAVGEKLCEDVPIYFNTMLAVDRQHKKTILCTKPTAMVQTKVEAFDRVKSEYTLIENGIGKPGLAEFFADCGFKGPT